MRTISVREAAVALGITPRAVTYRLDKGHLKGTLTKNEFGVPEWRIYPNKEIVAGLNKAATSTAINFEPNEVVDAESIGPENDHAFQQSETIPTSTLQSVIEQCMRPLVDEVKAQALALAEKDKLIEDQKRQLLLLPDFQKRADEERNAAVLKALEVEALNKQIAAMEEEKQLLEAKANEASALAADLQSLKATVEGLKAPWWKKWFAAAPEA